MIELVIAIAAPMYHHEADVLSVLQLGLSQDNLEAMIDGTQGRINYFFQTFGAVAILFIEMKFKVGNDVERLNAICSGYS